METRSSHSSTCRHGGDSATRDNVCISRDGNAADGVFLKWTSETPLEVSKRIYEAQVDS